MAQITNDHAVFTVAKLLDVIDRSNPEIGMGPPAHVFVDRACAELGIHERDINYDSVVRLVGNSMRRR